MIEINLLPRKEFEIVLKSGEVTQTIPGKFGTWSAKRFGDIKKFSLKQLGEYLERDLSFDDICLNILCAVEYGCRKSKMPFIYGDIDVCEWIDEMGGIGSEIFQSLTLHAGSDLQEKKNLEPSSNGTSLSESPSVQD